MSDDELHEAEREEWFAKIARRESQASSEARADRAAWMLYHHMVFDEIKRRRKPFRVRLRRGPSERFGRSRRASWVSTDGDYVSRGHARVWGQMLLKQLSPSDGFIGAAVFQGRRLIERIP
jgi:hypothetical protein